VEGKKTAAVKNKNGCIFKRSLGLPMDHVKRYGKGNTASGAPITEKRVNRQKRHELREGGRNTKPDYLWICYNNSLSQGQTRDSNHTPIEVS